MRKGQPSRYQMNSVKQWLNYTDLIACLQRSRERPNYTCMRNENMRPQQKINSTCKQQPQLCTSKVTGVYCI